MYFGLVSRRSKFFYCFWQSRHFDVIFDKILAEFNKVFNLEKFVIYVLQKFNWKSYMAPVVICFS